MTTAKSTRKTYKIDHVTVTYFKYDNQYSAHFDTTSDDTATMLAVFKKTGKYKTIKQIKKIADELSCANFTL